MVCFDRAVAKDTLVFIPAWNEAENLPSVLRELKREIPEADVLVIDDGSTDRTAEVARVHAAGGSSRSTRTEGCGPASCLR